MKKTITMTVWVTLLLSMITMSKGYAYFYNNVLDSATQKEASVSIGDYQMTPAIEPFDYNKQYHIGDQFTYNGKVWTVMLENPGVSQWNLPGSGAWQGIQDDSIDYQTYNYYVPGDVVRYKNKWYEAVYDWASYFKPSPSSNVPWQQIPNPNL